MALSNQSKVIFYNILSLFSIQGLNYLLPLVNIPYMVRVLGPDKYGVLGFSAAFIAFFNILIVFGFNLSGAQQISIHRTNLQNRSKILCTIILSQLIIALISLFIMILILSASSKLNEHYQIHIYYFLVSVITILQPAWFFQGMEKMKFITLTTFISKAIFTLGIFLLIKKPSHYVLVPKLMFIGGCVGSILTLLILKYKFHIIYYRPSFRDITDQIQKSKYIFFSDIVTSAYTQSVTFILGIFHSNAVVGYFSAVDKLIKACQGLFQPIVTAFFPYIAKTVNIEKRKIRLVLRKLLLGFAISSVFFGTGLFLFSKQIIDIVFGDEFIPSKAVLRIMSANIPLVAIASILASLIFIGFGKSEKLSKIYTISAFLALILAFILIPVSGERGAAYTVLGAEAASTTLMLTYLWIKKKEVFY